MRLSFCLKWGYNLILHVILNDPFLLYTNFLTGDLLLYYLIHYTLYQVHYLVIVRGRTELTLNHNKYELNYRKNIEHYEQSKINNLEEYRNGRILYLILVLQNSLKLS